MSDQQRAELETGVENLIDYKIIKIEINYIKIAINEIKDLISETKKDNEDKNSRIIDLEREYELLRKECETCREKVTSKIGKIEDGPMNFIKTAQIIMGLLISLSVLSGIIIGGILALSKAGVLGG